MASMFGGIEAGGTKFICAVGTGPDYLRAEARFPTTTPEATIRSAIEFFRQQTNRFGKLEAICVASFGPLDPRPDSPTYGYITTTPKPGKLGVVLESFQFIGGPRPEGEADSPRISRPAASASSPAAAPATDRNGPTDAGAPAPDDDDVPF